MEGEFKINIFFNKNGKEIVKTSIYKKGRI